MKKNLQNKLKELMYNKDDDFDLTDYIPKKKKHEKKSLPKRSDKSDKQHTPKLGGTEELF